MRKKAALCLLRLLRKTPPDQQLLTADAFAPAAAALLEERDVGLLLASATLLQGIVTRFGPGDFRHVCVCVCVCVVSTRVAQHTCAAACHNAAAPD